MGIPSVYINLEDDVSKVVERLKHNRAKEIVLVCPKRCFLLSDSINLRLLKKQMDLLGKEIFILTMDERGQGYAREAGFRLKFLPKGPSGKGFGDVRVSKKMVSPATAPKAVQPPVDHFAQLKNAAKKFVPAAILPSLKPQEKPKSPVVHQSEPEVAVTENVFPWEAEADSADGGREQKTHLNKVITGVVALTLLVVLLLIFVILPKATVVVYPSSEPVTRDMDVSMSVSASSTDPSRLVMPAQKLDDTINLGDTFQSQGKQQVGNKASGTVKIYNFTKLPINLRASTTLLTAGSKTYNLLNDVTGLKPTTYSDARTKEVNPASLGASVEIVANGGGDDFNLPAGTRLEITNQVFGSKPLLLYAISDTEITGGTTRYLSVITADDISSAKQQLLQNALQQERDRLSPSGEVLTDGAFTIDAPQFSTDNAVGVQTPSFSATAQVHIFGLAFKQSDLQNLVFQRTEETLDPGKTLQQDSAQSLYTVKTLDLTNQLMVLSYHFQGQAIFNVDLSNITPQLVGKSQTQAYEILRSKAQINRVDITLAPVWQKSFPFFASKISVQIATTTPTQ